MKRFIPFSLVSVPVMALLIVILDMIAAWLDMPSWTDLVLKCIALFAVAFVSGAIVKGVTKFVEMYREDEERALDERLYGRRGE